MQQRLINLHSSDATNASWDVDLRGVRSIQLLEFDAATATKKSHYSLYSSIGTRAVNTAQESDGKRSAFIAPLNFSAEEVTTQTQSTTDAEILALQPTVWLDWSESTKLIPQTQVVGTHLTAIAGRDLPDTGTDTLLYAGAAGFTLEDFGATKCVRSSVAWYGFSDNSTPNKEEDLESSCTFMFNTGTLASYWIWVSRMYKIKIQNRFLAFVDKSNSGTVRSTGLVTAADTDYLVQVLRNSNVEFTFLLRNLETGVEQTATMPIIVAQTQSPGVNWLISYAQSGMLGSEFSHIVILPSKSTAAAAKVKEWMLAKYSGVTTQSTTSSAYALSLADSRRLPPLMFANADIQKISFGVREKTSDEDLQLTGDYRAILSVTSRSL
tara:strand:+ start:7171 stop:8313 length:1143 start_codon:yes stop_codon:yes gene_type:complete